MHCAVSVRKEEPRGVEWKGRLSRQQTRRSLGEHDGATTTLQILIQKEAVSLKTVWFFVETLSDFGSSHIRLSSRVILCHRIHLQVMFSPVYVLSSLHLKLPLGGDQVLNAS